MIHANSVKGIKPFAMSAANAVKRNKQVEYKNFFLGDRASLCDSKFNDCDSKFDDGRSESWEEVPEEDIQQDLQFDERKTHPANDNLVGTEGCQVVMHWVLLFLSVWTATFNIPVTALSALLRFLDNFIHSCSLLCPKLAALHQLFPKTIHLFDKATLSSHANFKKTVVCPKCHSLYDFEDCVKVDIRGKKKSAVCGFVRYPNHPHRKQREKCGTTLLKEVTLKDGKIRLYPRKIYCYKSIRESLIYMLQQPGFSEKCEHWRKRHHIPGTYRDVYDGRVWRKFMKYKDRPFFEQPGRLGLMLNLDFFQPYKHTAYSVGVFYFSIMNLPRDQRFLKEYILISGILPGAKEPSPYQLNCYLKPLVDDLILLWEEGISLTVNGKEEQFYAMVLSIASDVPAARKLSGFLSRYP
jgi:hypothetical protein